MEITASEGRTRSLLVLHIGPVQDWIAQARRTRDSWFGSHYLSEISKAAAKALFDAEAQVELVFPHKRDKRQLDADLQPWDSPLVPHLNLEADGDDDETSILEWKSAFNVANKIVAVVEGDPREHAARARTAAITRWRKIVDRTLKRPKCQVLVDWSRQALIEEQRDTLLELYAVWAPLPAEGYGEVFATLNQALNARKRLREFRRWEQDPGGVPRSSLDGARASILMRPPEGGANGGAQAEHLRARARLRIEPNEHLDAVGLARRAGGGPDQFVPLVNVALVEWIRRAHERCPDQLEALRRECEVLEKRDQEGCLRRVHRRDLEWTRWFPFDAHIFREERWEKLLEEMKARAGKGSPIEDVQKFRPWCEKHVRPVLRRMSEPPDYVACIIADGDGMGKMLQKLKQVRQHQIFSEELSRFAGEARTIVEQRHFGSLVFSGGDDVFGWVPVERAIRCADDLRRCFAEIMADALRRAGELAGADDDPLCSTRPPTLSVGIGIGHVMEAMGTLINLARDAEKLAKGDELPEGLQRDALAVVLEKRSGDPLKWRAPWGTDPGARLAADLELLLDGGLSFGKIHEMRAMHCRLPEPDETPGNRHEAFRSLLELEIGRILARNEGRSGRKEYTIRFADLGESAGSSRTYAELHQAVGDVITRLLLAVHVYQQRADGRLEPGTPAAEAGVDAGGAA